MKPVFLGLILAAAPGICAEPDPQAAAAEILAQDRIRLQGTVQDWQDNLAKFPPALREKYAPELARIRADAAGSQTVEDFRPVELRLDAWKKALVYELDPRQVQGTRDSVRFAQSQVEAFQSVARREPSLLSPEQKSFLAELKARISAARDSESLGRIFDNAGLSQPAPLPETVYQPGAAGMMLTQGKGLAIRDLPSTAELRDGSERRSMWDRVKSWLGIPYKLGADSKFAMDCSAFISRIWGVARHTTATFLDVAYPIGKEELKPGDALLLDIKNSHTGYGHIRLFAGWADDQKKEMWIYEESPATGSAYKKAAYSKSYQPIRRKDLPRSVPGVLPVAMTAAAPQQKVPASDGSGCASFSTIGCLYVPQAARDAAGARLVVFLRGHYRSFAGHVTGKDRVLAAAKEAFAERGLRAAADAAGAAMLVTGSSDIGLTAADVSAAEARAGSSFSRVILAAHSGGHSGLNKTLGSGTFPKDRVLRVVMLDDFYGTYNVEPIRKLAGNADFSCVGFYTAQSDAYVAAVKAYQPLCAIDKRSGQGAHSQGVNDCLAGYLEGRPCR